MALARYESVAVNTAGDVIPNATVEVRRDQPGRPVVPLFSDREGTIPLGNPITTDSEGKFGFHVVGGSYYIRVFTGPSQQPLQQYVRRYQAIGTAGERDVEDLASALEAGTATYPTRAELEAFVPEVEGIGGKVTAGEDAGFYHYDFTGEAWVFDRPLFDTLARMNVIGGDANDIEAVIASGVADSAVVMLWIEAPATNTAPVRINDIPVLTIDEEELLPGQWLAGRTYWFSDESTFYKLRTESDVSGLVAQAEAAATAALDAQDASETAQTGAEAARDEAQGYAAGLNIPAIVGGDAGKQLQVKDDETGFELVDPLEVLDEDDMASDSSTAVPSQKSVKAYVDDYWRTQPRGAPIPIFADLFDTIAEALPPTDQSYRYILLTAGKAGSGEYNEGILTNESVSGSYPLVIATAEITYPTSPFDGKTVHLLNTEGRYLIGGVTAGVVRMDQMQQITGTIGTTGSGGLWGSISGVSGAFSAVADGTANQPASGSTAARTLSFDSADSPGARAGAETHGKDIAVLYVLRII